MNRYIDADKLLKNEIVRCQCVPWVGSGDNNYKDLDDVLNDAPTADVVEVRHGRWVDNHCSLCGITSIDDRLYKSLDICPPKCDYYMKYCPECGAKMDGERNENGT